MHITPHKAQHATLAGKILRWLISQRMSKAKGKGSQDTGSSKAKQTKTKQKVKSAALGGSVNIDATICECPTQGRIIS